MPQRLQSVGGHRTAILSYVSSQQGTRQRRRGMVRGTPRGRTRNRIAVDQDTRKKQIAQALQAIADLNERLSTANATVAKVRRMLAARASDIDGRSALATREPPRPD